MNHIEPKLLYSFKCVDAEYGSILLMKQLGLYQRQSKFLKLAIY